MWFTTRDLWCHRPPLKHLVWCRDVDCTCSAFCLDSAELGQELSVFGRTNQLNCWTCEWFAASTMSVDFLPRLLFLHAGCHWRTINCMILYERHLQQHVSGIVWPQCSESVIVINFVFPCLVDVSFQSFNYNQDTLEVTLFTLFPRRRVSPDPKRPQVSRWWTLPEMREAESETECIKMPIEKYHQS